MSVLLQVFDFSKSTHLLKYWEEEVVMVRKLLINILALVCVIACVFGMVACDITKEHTHTFDSKWSYDDDFHWHAATCEHTSEKKDRAAHNLVDGKCVVCDFEDDSAPKIYKTVTFNLNGGDGNIDSMQFVVGKVMSDLPNPTRNGYKFICWEEALGSEYTPASVMPDRNLSLIAKWEKVLTKYSDKYVSFKPATEGVKNSLLQLEYGDQVDKFIYVEITSDDLGGVDKVGQSNNFNLRSMDGMEYKVNSGYTWAWFQGSFDVPNGAQRFTLDYGSNIQFVTISDGNGVVQQTYLVDLYVMHDYYISLYNNIYETEPYEKVRIIENERFQESYKTAESKFEADKRVYKNAETGNFEDFVYSTAITKNWSLYQTYKPYTIEAELDGAILDGKLEIKPYTTEYVLPVPVKEGYDFLGWKNSDGKYLTDMEGNGGIKYLAEKTDKTKPAAISVSDKLIAAFEVSNKFYDADCDVVSSFNAVRKLTYTDKYNTEISRTTFTAEAGHKITSGTVRVEVGKEITVTAGKLGHTFKGWYDGKIKLSDEAEYTFAMPLENINYSAEYEVAEELKPFLFTATADTVTITGIQDKTVVEIVVPDYVTNIKHGAFEDCNSIKSITLPFVGEASKDSNSVYFGWIFGAYNSSPQWAYVPESLKRVVITNTTSIGKHAFSDCRNITSITISESVTFIDSYAFVDCYKLVEVYNLSSLNITKGAESHGGIAYYAKSVYTSLDEKSKVETTDDGYTFYADDDEVYLINYNGKERELTLPDNFKGKNYAINNHAFYSFASVDDIDRVCQFEKLIIPRGVTAIGDQAFGYCKKLTDVTISDSVNYISNGAFLACHNIENITIPFVGETKDGVENVLFGSIFGATSYEGIINYVSESLKTVTITGGTTIGDNAFRGCEYITNITLPQTLTSIGNNSFYACEGLTEIELPEELENIGNNAFYGCINITNITVPDSVTNIGYSAFGACNLESITIPFVGDRIRESSDTTQYPLGYIFATRGYQDVPTVSIKQFKNGNSSTANAVNYYFPLSLESVTITGGNILYGAFYNCSTLTNITIPEDITSIGKYAFYGCSNLKNLELPENLTDIGQLAFSGCSSLESINIPKGIQSIKDEFNNCGFTSLVIPDTVTLIYNGALNGCSKLESLTIPFVGGAFTTANEKNAVPFGHIFGSSSYIGGVAITQNYYKDNTTTTSSRYYIPSRLKEVTVTGENLHYGAFDNCEDITVVLTENLRYISEGAFGRTVEQTIKYTGDITSLCKVDNYSLNKLLIDGEELTGEIIIPEGVTSIGAGMFFAFNEVTSVKLPNSVTSIGDRAFEYCRSLTSVTIGNSVTKIGFYAFDNCSNLNKVYYKGTSTEWSSIIINSGNSYLTNATRYYYSETQPTDTENNYWHYAEDGVTVVEW